MSTPAQALASKENASHSTGPRTEAGKAVSRLNALRHGATSRALVLPGEDPAEYVRFESALLADLRPTTEAEQDQARRVAALSWRVRRMYDMERSVFAASMDQLGVDNFADAAELFMDPEQSKRLRLFHRYLTSAERAYNRALADYRTMQKQNAQYASENALADAWLDKVRGQIAEFESADAAEPEPAHEPVASEPVSFVSQNEEAPCRMPATTDMNPAEHIATDQRKAA